MVNSKLRDSAIKHLSNKSSATAEEAQRINDMWSKAFMPRYTDNPYYLVTPWFPTWKHHKEIKELGLEVFKELGVFSRSKEQTVIVYSMRFNRLSEDHRASAEKAPIELYELYECTFEEFIAYIQAVKLNVDISKLWDQTNEDS